MFGIVCGVRRGLMRGAKEGDGLASRYMEMRDSISVTCQSQILSRGFRHQATFMVSVKKIVIGIAESELVGYRRYLVPSIKVPPQLVIRE